MGRKKKTIPELREKADGRACVYLDRQTVYLGKAGTPELIERYSALIANIAQGKSAEEILSPPANRPRLSIAELCLRYLTSRLPRHSTDEQHCQRGAIKALRILFAETPVDDFGPLRFKAVRQSMVERGWSRGYINHQMRRLTAVFRWGVSEEIVPVAVYESLKAVSALSVADIGRPDPEPREAVSAERLNAVRAVLRGRTLDMFNLCLLCSCRPGELMLLTTGCIDRSGDVWKAELKKHKTAARGKRRALFFNADAQAILAKYLQADPERTLFRIRRDTFSAAIKRACEIAFGMPDELRRPNRDLPPDELKAVKLRAKAWRRKHCFTGHWLRHTALTAIRDAAGLEAAQAVGGHSSRVMTEGYTLASQKLAKDAVGVLKLG